MMSRPLAPRGFAPVLISILAAVGLGLVLLAYERFPVHYVWLVTEDSWGENGTFFAWLLTFFVLSRAIWRGPDLRRPGILLFAATALFIALEEISWGQRILGFEPPELFELHNRQSEFTFHNFLPNPDRDPLGMILVLGAVLPFLATRVLPGLRSWMNRWGLPVVPPRLWALFFATAWLFFDPGHLQKVDEIAELFLGVCALVFALEVVKPRAEDDNAAQIATMILVVVLGAVIMTWGVGRESDQRRWLNDFASTRLPYRGRLEQSSLIFAFLAEHPELRQEDTWLNFAMVLLRLNEVERATEVIGRGLEEQQARLEEKPRDERAHRNRGTLLGLLGRQDEAAESFSQALALDRSRLLKAEDLAEEVELRWSIAETHYAMGEFEVAQREAQEAAELAEDENTTKKILRWLEWEERRREALGRRALPSGETPPELP